MHILPVDHSIEVDGNVLYGDKSLVFDQAENLLYIEKALLLLLFNR
jgi:ornithine carbamoyltransferase